MTDDLDDHLDAVGPVASLLLVVFLSSALVIVGVAVNLMVWQVGLLLMIAGSVGLVAGPVWVWLRWRGRPGEESGDGGRG